MKIAIIILGVLLLIIPTFALIQYASDYNSLSEYGRGYIWGNVLLILVALGIIYFGYKKSK